MPFSAKPVQRLFHSAGRKYNDDQSATETGAQAIENAVYQAVKVAESGIIAEIEANIGKMKVQEGES